MGRYDTMRSREYSGAFVPLNINTTRVGNACCLLVRAIVLRSMAWRWGHPTPTCRKWHVGHGLVPRIARQRNANECQRHVMWSENRDYVWYVQHGKKIFFCRTHFFFVPPPPRGGPPEKKISHPISKSPPPPLDTDSSSATNSSSGGTSSTSSESSSESSSSDRSTKVVVARGQKKVYKKTAKQHCGQAKQAQSGKTAVAASLAQKRQAPERKSSSDSKRQRK